MRAAAWLPLVSHLKRTRDGVYEVRGITTGILIGWVTRRSPRRWHGDVAVFLADGTHELDQGQVVRRPLAADLGTRQEAWADVERQAIADALSPDP